MIRVVAKNFIKADKVNMFARLAIKLVADSRQEVGCILYELLQDEKNPQILTIYQDWYDQESLDDHMATKHFKEAFASFEEYLEKPTEINIYKILA